MQEDVEILLITGPAGIGKSTLCWEIGAQLAASKLAHAIIETDELDRAFPRPTPEQLSALKPGTSDVSALNLAAMWEIYRALGHTRLVMSGVMLDLEADCRWITSAIPRARITAVRLVGSESTLMQRIDQREIGSGRDAQARRSLRQLKRVSEEAPSAAMIVRTDDKTPAELAQIVLKALRWV
jgi:predicted ATP-dependent serine protease